MPYLGPAVAIAALLYTIVSARSKANNEAVTGLDERLDDVEDKVTVLDQKLRSLPDKDAMHRLELSMERLTGNVEVLGERIKPVAATCQRLQEALERKS